MSLLARTCLTGAVLLVAGCGARTPLWEQTIQDASGPPAYQDAGDTGPSTDAAVLADSSDGDAPADAAPEAMVEIPCALLVSGSATRVLSFTEKQATAAGMVAYDPGDQAGNLPAYVAIQSFASGGSYEPHDDVRVAGFRIGPDWPGGVELEHAAVSVGTESHGWGEMVAGAGNELAMAWHGDQGGTGHPRFRKLDLGSWTPGDTATPSPTGEAVVALAAGASVGASGVGWSGTGYAVAWRSVETEADGGTLTTPMVAVLGESGNPLLGPHAVTVGAAYPGPTPSIAWSGTTYLIATSTKTCAVADPLCQPGAVVISKIRPASSAGNDDSGVEFVAAIPAQDPGTAPGNARVVTYSGVTWAGWFEGDPNNTDAPRILRVVRLSGDGSLLSVPLTVVTGAHPTTRLSMTVGELGPVITWPEDVNKQLSPLTVGYSAIRVVRLSHEGQLLGDVSIPSTAFGSYGTTAPVTLANPRAILVAWAGYATASGYDVIWLGRVDCVEK